MKYNYISLFWGTFAFLYAFFLLQGLPLTFGDDLNIIYVAKESSWISLFYEFINPFTPAWYVHGIDCQLTTRVFQTLVFKFLHLWFGYSADVFNFHKALAFGVCAALIFKIMRKHLLSGLSGVIAVLFFIFSAPIFISTSWIADTEILAQSFLLVSCYCFLRIICAVEPISLQKFIILGLIYFTCGWIAIKLKETARLLPFVTSIYSFIYFFLWRNSKALISLPRHSFVLVLTFILLFSVIPFFPDINLDLDEKSISAVKHFQLSGITSFFIFFISDIFYPLLFTGIAFILGYVFKYKRKIF